MPTLIERLRLGTNMHDRACHLAMHEAAERIAELERENERLRVGIAGARELERAVKDAYVALQRTLSN